MVKRLLDVVLSSLALVVLLPLFLVVAALIKLDSPGPVFYRGVRVGRFGKAFRIYKFRTMILGADRLGGPSTAADDLRITRAGRWIRRFNFDELPQFLNVLKGEMSIVGPRPEVPDVVALYPQEERQAVLSIRPGITDWATLWIQNEGRRLEGSPDPHQTYLQEIWPAKRRLQLEYLRRQSLATDLRIIGSTLRIHLIDRISPRVQSSAARGSGSQETREEDCVP